MSICIKRKARIVPPINGDQVVQQWMQTNYLASHDLYLADFKHPATTTTGQVPGGYSYTVYSWKDSKGKDIQAYWKIHGLGHAWSGGSSSGSYTDPLGPNASEAIYQFFMNQRWIGANENDSSPWRKMQRAIENPFRLLKSKKEG